MVALNEIHRAELLKRAGGGLSAAEVSELLGMGEAAIEELRAGGTLLALKQGGDWLYPRCQFTNAKPIRGVSEVVRGMAENGPWITLDFLLAPDTVLEGLTPLQAMSRGGLETVLRLVRADAADDGFS